MIHPTYQQRTRLRRLIQWLRTQGYNGWQIFYRRNVVGDPTVIVYKQDGVTVELCPDWEYLEILGLTEDEQQALCREGEDLNV